MTLGVLRSVKLYILDFIGFVYMPDCMLAIDVLAFSECQKSRVKGNVKHRQY